jgi:hypothetical protein
MQMIPVALGAVFDRGISRDTQPIVQWRTTLGQPCRLCLTPGTWQLRCSNDWRLGGIIYAAQLIVQRVPKGPIVACRLCEIVEATRRSHEVWAGGGQPSNGQRCSRMPGGILQSGGRLFGVGRIGERYAGEGIDQVANDIRRL